GTQNYTCTSTVVADAGTGDDGGAAVYAWTFTGPLATLSDCAGVTIGAHFASSAGPTAPEWETVIDGTAVIGRRLAAVTPDATALPWLLLQATSHVGTGTLSRAQYIQRVHTHGGLAPTTGCDAMHVGTMQNVPYTADYY